MRSTGAVLTLLVAVLACGCGSGSSGSTGAAKAPESAAARQIRATVEHWLATLQTATRDGNNARACAYLTPGLRDAITQQLRMRGEQATCKTYAAKWTGGSTPPGRDGAHVRAVTVSGAKATAALEAPPDRQSDVRLKRVGSRWLIDNY